GNDAAAIDAAARQVAAERMPEIVAIQEHQRKQTQTFLRSDRLSSRLAMWLLPLLAKSGLARLLIGKRLPALQHGVRPGRLQGRGVRRRIVESRRVATRWEFKGQGEPVAAADGRRHFGFWEFVAHWGGGRC